MATRYQFPLNDTDYYAGRVIFQVRVEEPPSVSVLSTNRVKTDESTDGNSEVSLLEQAKAALSNNVSISGQTKVTLGERATLYLPQGITFNDGVVYERADLGRIGGVAELATKNGSSLTRALSESYKDTVSSFTDMFNRSLSPDAARLVTAQTAKRINSDIGEGVSSALRVTTNPNQRQLFKEVNVREFSFNFKLIPVSKEEADMAVALVKFFRTELYPEDAIHIDTGGTQTVPIGYRYPNTFDIMFKHKDKKIAHRLLPSYLYSMQTVYNGTGAGFFEDGNFSEIEITLNFRESRTLTKALVRDGGY